MEGGANSDAAPLQTEHIQSVTLHALLGRCSSKSNTSAMLEEWCVKASQEEPCVLPAKCPFCEDGRVGYVTPHCRGFTVPTFLVNKRNAGNRRRNLMRSSRGACCACCACPECAKRVLYHWQHVQGIVDEGECDNEQVDDDTGSDGGSQPATPTPQRSATNDFDGSDSDSDECTSHSDKFTKPFRVLGMDPREYVDDIATNPLSTPCGYRESLPTSAPAVYRFLFPIPAHYKGGVLVEERWVSVVVFLNAGFKDRSRTVIETSGDWPTDKPNEKRGDLRYNFPFDGTYDQFCRLYDYDDQRFFPRVVTDIIRRRLVDNIPFATLIDTMGVERNGLTCPPPFEDDYYFPSPIKRQCLSTDVFKINARLFAVCMDINKFAGIIGVTPRGAVSCITCNRRQSPCDHLSFWQDFVAATFLSDEWWPSYDPPFIDEGSGISSAYFPPTQPCHIPPLHRNRTKDRLDGKNIAKYPYLNRLSPTRMQPLEATCADCGDNASYDATTEVKRPGLVMDDSLAITATVTLERLCLSCNKTCHFCPQDFALTLVRDAPALRKKQLPKDHEPTIWDTHMIFLCTFWLRGFMLTIDYIKDARKSEYESMARSYRYTGELRALLPERTMFIRWLMKYIDVVLSAHASKNESNLLCNDCGTSNLSGERVSFGVLTRLMPPYMLNKYYNSSPSQEPLILFKGKHVTHRGTPFANVAFVVGEAGHSLLCVIRSETLIYYSQAPPLIPASDSMSCLSAARKPKRKKTANVPPVDVYDKHFERLKSLLDVDSGDKRYTEDPMWRALRFVVDDFARYQDLLDGLSDSEKKLLWIISSKSPFPTGKGATLALALFVAATGCDLSTTTIPSLDDVPTASHLGRHAAVTALQDKHEEILRHTDGARGLYGSASYPTSLSKVTLDDLVSEFRLPLASEKGTMEHNYNILEMADKALEGTAGIALRAYLRRVTLFDGVFNTSQPQTVMSILSKSFPHLIIVRRTKEIGPCFVPRRWRKFCEAYANKITHLLQEEPILDHEKIGVSNTTHSTLTSLAEMINASPAWHYDKDKSADPSLVVMVQALECDMLMPVSREELSHCGIRAGPHFTNIRRRAKLYKADIAKNTSGLSGTLGLPRAISDPSGKGRAVNDYIPYGSTCEKCPLNKSAFCGSLFMWTCACKMRKYQGGMLLDSGEDGARGYFDILMRLKKPPEIILFDDACLLQTYCMTREPHFFWGRRFIIENFSNSYHAECSKLCLARKWPDLRRHNTSEREHSNARNQVKSAGRYMPFMNIPNYLNNLELIMEHRNDSADARREKVEMLASRARPKDRDRPIGE